MAKIWFYKTADLFDSLPGEYRERMDRGERLKDADINSLEPGSVFRLGPNHPNGNRTYRLLKKRPSAFGANAWSVDLEDVDTGEVLNRNRIDESHNLRLV